MLNTTLYANGTYNRLTRTSALTRTLALASIATTAALHATPAHAVGLDELPTGESVQDGTITNFDRTTPGYLGVHQSSDRAVINWDTFNIGQNATTEFFQPGTTALTVNRVVGPQLDPTQILGTLRANGRVMVLDRNGVLFGVNSHIDVGGIIAATGDLSTADAMTLDTFNLTNFAAGSKVINRGEITVAEGGLAALVAPTVENSGIINARMGRVVLAAGDAVTVDLYGDGLFEITDSVIAEHDKLKAINKGTIEAEGGVVQMSVGTAKNIVDSVVNTRGVVTVASASMQGGKIVLSSKGKVNVRGKVDASYEGGDDAFNGGTIDISAGTDVSLKKNAHVMTTFGGQIDITAGDDVLMTGAPTDGWWVPTVYSGGGDINITSGDEVRILDGHSINALGGDIVIDNGGALLAEAGSINTLDYGNVTVNQNMDGDVPEGLLGLATLQAAVDAVHVGTYGMVTLNAGAGNWNENLVVTNDWLSNFTLNGAQKGVKADGGRDAFNGDTETIIRSLDVSSLYNAIVDGISQNGNYETGDGLRFTYVDNVTVKNSFVKNNNDDGIDVHYGRYVHIADNDITNHPGSHYGYYGYYGYYGFNDDDGSDGVYINGRDEWYEYNEEYGYNWYYSNDYYTDVEVLNNTISNTGDDGVEVVYGGNILVAGNDISYAGLVPNYYGWYPSYYTPYGADGISIRSAYGRFYGEGLQKTAEVEIENPESEYSLGGFRVAVLDNEIFNTLDDGIEINGVSGRVKVADNDISFTGAITGPSVDEDFVFYSFGDYYGGDGIHIRNVYGYGNVPDGNTVGSIETGYEDEGYDVVVLNNEILGTQDDGIEVVSIDGTVLVGGNTTIGNGLYNPLYGGYYGEGDYYGYTIGDGYGADGIHIRNVRSPYKYMPTIVDYSEGSEGSEGGYDYAGFGIVVVGNTVQATQDDGIEVRDSSYRTLIAENTVNGAGIINHLLSGMNAFYYNDANYGYTGNIYAYFNGANEHNGIAVHNVEAEEGYYGGYYDGYYDFVSLDLPSEPGPTDVEILDNHVVPGSLTLPGYYGYEEEPTVYRTTSYYGEGDAPSLYLSEGATHNGIKVENYAGRILIDGNEVDTVGQDIVTGMSTGHGIVVNSLYGGEECWDCYYGDARVSLYDYEGYYGGGLDVTITNNDVTNTGEDGIHTYNIDLLEIGDNTLTDLGDNGVNVTGPLYGYVNVHGNSVTNADEAGMRFESGLIDLTGDTNTINGAEVGLLFEPVAEIMYGKYVMEEYVPDYSRVDLVDNTIGTTNFRNIDDFYVALYNGALFEPGTPTLEDGSFATYDGFTPGGGPITGVRLAFLESKFWHYNDDPTVGLFFWGGQGSFDESDVFNEDFNPFAPPSGRAGFTITGLPGGPTGGAGGTGGGPTNPANIEPAAGGDDTGEDVAGTEPAAGGGDVACWGDATAAAAQGQATNYDFTTSPEDALADSNRCANRPE